MGPYIIAIVGAMAGATGLFNLIQFLITRKDNYKKQNEELSDQLESIKKELEGVREENLKTEAINARIRIIQAADHLRHTASYHSEEYFDQLHDDITLYEAYCNTHDNFLNNKAKHAIEYINSVYAEALKEDKFL